MDFFLFGSGEMVIGVARYLRNKGFSPIVICAARHLKEVYGGYSFEQHLDKAGINYRKSGDANTDSGLRSLIGARSCGFSLGAAWIFNKSFIELFDLGFYNMHNARLPHDRGGGGFSWRIMRGERRGACAIHQVVPKTDAGPVVKYREFTYPASCRIPADFIEFTTERAEEMIREWFDDVIRGDTPRQSAAQSEHHSIYWPRLDTDLHGFIDWSWGAGQMERFICAFDDPYKGASTFIGSSRLRLKKAFMLVNDGGFHPFQSGIIYRKSATELFISCNDAALVVHSVTNDAGEDMLPDLRTGDRFHTPSAHLEKARAARVYYHPEGKSLTRAILGHVDGS
jgi:methionyl-tRNA formyltransferase